MAWNGSTNTSAPAPEKPEPKAPSLSHGLIALIGVVVVGGGLAVWLMSGSDRKAPAVPAAPKASIAIAEHTPAPAPKEAEEVVAKKPVDPREDYDHEKMYRDDRGILRYKNGCRAPDPTRPRRPSLSASSVCVTVFSNHSDRAIAALISAEPGAPVFIERDYSDPNLKQAFIESLTEPIRINEDDSDYHKDLKRAVIETRKEVAARIGAGEDFAQILGEAQKELQRLASLRRDLDGQIASIVSDSRDLTNEDVHDLVAAANKMLEEKGASPIEADQFVKWNIRLNAESVGEDPNAAVEAYEAAVEASEAAAEASEKEKTNE